MIQGLYDARVEHEPGLVEDGISKTLGQRGIAIW